jgi:hypothetical protein
VGHIDGTQGAGLVAREWADWQADACFIDTGGFGSSWIDNLRRLGREPSRIAFSGRATDPRYDNKRTEMYFEAVDWIRKGGPTARLGEPGADRGVEKVTVDPPTTGAPAGGFSEGIEYAKKVALELSVKPPRNPGEQMIYDQKAPVLKEFQDAVCRVIDADVASGRASIEERP